MSASVTPAVVTRSEQTTRGKRSPICFRLRPALKSLKALAVASDVPSATSATAAATPPPSNSSTRPIGLSSAASVETQAPIPPSTSRGMVIPTKTHAKTPRGELCEGSTRERSHACTVQEIDTLRPSPTASRKGPTGKPSMPGGSGAGGTSEAPTMSQMLMTSMTALMAVPRMRISRTPTMTTVTSMATTALNATVKGIPSDVASASTPKRSLSAL